MSAFSFLHSAAFLAGGLLLLYGAGYPRVSAAKLVGFVVAVQTGAFVGARALFLLNRGGSDWTDALNLSPGGFAFNGGAAAALLTAYLYLRWAGLPFLAVADRAAPSVALGVFLTKTGCFLGGCCFGMPTTLPWGVTFPASSPAAAAFGVDHRVHPAQLYEAAAGALLLLLVLVVRKRCERAPGRLFLTLALGYLLVRGLNDLVRGDARPYLVWSLSQTQVVSIVFAVVALSLWRATATSSLSQEPA